MSPVGVTTYSFRYRIVGGTGAYAGAWGEGDAVLQERGEQRPVEHRGTMHPDFIIAPSFTLRFQAPEIPHAQA